MICLIQQYIIIIIIDIINDIILRDNNILLNSNELNIIIKIKNITKNKADKLKKVKVK
jgi:hypothetical protein